MVIVLQNLRGSSAAGGCMEKKRPYNRKPNSRSPGRPKVLEGETQIITTVLERELCERIDRLVSASKGEYATRSEFVRAAVERLVKDAGATQVRRRRGVVWRTIGAAVEASAAEQAIKLRRKLETAKAPEIHPANAPVVTIRPKTK